MSVWDDTFTGTNDDPPDPSKWEVVQNTNDAYHIYDNKLRLQYHVSPYTPENTYIDIRGKYYLTGDFDIQISCVRYAGSSSGAYVWRTLEVISEDETQWAGVGYFAGGGSYGFFSCDDTGSLSPNNRVNWAGEIDNPEIVRVTRSGSAIVVYRWDAGHSAWEGAFSDTGGWSMRSISGNVRVRLHGFAASGKDAWWDLDDFVINSGDTEALAEQGVSEIGVGVEASADANVELSVSTEENAGVEVQADASYGGATAEVGAGVNADADARQESGKYSVANIGVNALADAAFGLFNGSVDFNAGVKFDADAFIVDGRIYPNAGVSVEADALLTTPHVDFEIGISVTSEGQRESESIGDYAESGIKVLADAYNYSEWVRENLVKAKKVFLFTLTGSADGVSDITIPISSFQARKRTGKPTYLSVTIPTFDYNDQIADRANGEMILYAGYRVGDTLSLIEEILHVDLDGIAPYKGPKSRSVILTGYRTTDFAPKNVTLENSVYSFLGAGSAQHRFANVDLFLNPGDTLTVDDDSMVVGSISYTVNTSSEMMQVFESQ